jgi:hypothetical protein
LTKKRRKTFLKLSKNNFCRRSREDSDFYGFDEEEEENFFTLYRWRPLPLPMMSNTSILHITTPQRLRRRLELR